MKRSSFFPILRLWAALLCMASGLALPALAQTNILPQTSDATDPAADHWYYIRFQRAADNTDANRYLVVGNAAAEGNTLQAKTLATGNDDQLWKLVATGTAGQYYLKNKAGFWLGYSGNRYKSVAEANRVAIDLKDSHNTSTIFPTGWQIHRVANNYTSCMNVVGGSSNGHELGDWDLNDGGNYVEFLDARTQAPPYYYIQFSAEGKALSTDGTTVTVYQPNGSEADGAGFKWANVYYEHGDGFYRKFYLKSDNGYYLVKNADGTLSVTATRTLGTLWRYSVNGNRYDIVDANATSQALTYNETTSTLGIASNGTEYSRLNPTGTFIPGIYFYFTFSGYGKKALVCNGTALEVADVTGSEPDGAGYKWRKKQRAGFADNEYIFYTDNGLYLKENADGTLGTTTEESEASKLTSSRNDYMQAVTRYQWATPTGKYISFNPATHGTTPFLSDVPHTRYGVMNFTEVLNGPTYGPVPGDKFSVTFPKKSEKLGGYAVNDKYLRKHIATLPNVTNVWLVEETGDGTGRVRLKNKSGLYLQNYTTDPIDGTACDNGGRYYLTEIQANASAFYIEEDAEANSTAYWQLRDPDAVSVQYLNSNQSDNTIRHKSANDSYNAVEFIFNETEVSQFYSYVYFTALGQFGLYDAGTGNPTRARKPDFNTEDRQENYIWCFETAANGLLLKSKAGRYLAWNATTETFYITDLSAQAQAFRLALNTFENNSCARLQLLRADDTSQALCAEYGTGELKWGAPNSRYSLIWIEAPAIAGPELPTFSTEVAEGARHHITFIQSGHVLKDMGAGEAVQHVEHNHHTLDPSTSWTVFRMSELSISPLTGNGHIGDTYIVSGLGNYLVYDATLGLLKTVPQQGNTPTRFRIVENDSRRESWQIQLPDQSDRMLQTADSKTVDETTYTNPIVLANPNNDNNYLRFEPLDIYPEFASETTGAWRFVRFVRRTAREFLTSSEAAPTRGSITSTPDRRYSAWRLIGTADDFVLKNGNDTYIHVDDAGNVTLTANAAEATSLLLHVDPYTLGEATLDFIVGVNNGQTDAEGHPALNLRWDATAGSIAAAAWPTADNYADYGLDFDMEVSPKFSDATEETFYQIQFPNTTGPLYLSDGHEKDDDAVGEALVSGYNGQLWIFTGDKDHALLKNRNGYYLTWNASNQTFDLTTDASLAAAFNMRKAESTYEYPAGYLELTAGADAAWLGKFLTLEADAKRVYHATLTAEATSTNTELTYAIETQPNLGEDYTAYRIRPKRSWFVKEVNDDKPAHPLSGFITAEDPAQPGEKYGFSKNPYTGQTEQTANTYEVVRYMKAGTQRNIYLPMAQQSSHVNRITAYQRWYNYKTGETIDPTRVILNNIKDKANPNSRRNYANGLVMGNILKLNGQNSGSYIVDHFTFKMPKVTTPDYEYIVGLDASAFTDFVDYYGENGNMPFSGVPTGALQIPEKQDLVEPTLSTRCKFIIRDARQIAKKLMACTEGSDKWLETYEFHVPAKKRAPHDYTYYYSTLPLSNTLENYWFYTDPNDESTLTNITSYDHIRFKLINNEAGLEGFDITDWPVAGTSRPTDNIGNKRFMRYLYKDEKANPGYTACPPGTKAVIGVYARANGKAGEANSGDVLYQLAKFTLYFDDMSEPRPYTEIIGRTADDKYKSGRSPEYLYKTVGEPIAAINFEGDDPFVPFVTPPVGTNTVLKNDNGLGQPAITLANTYRYPLEFARSAYSFLPIGGDFGGTGQTDENSWGTYTIAHHLRVGWGTQNLFRPVKSYYRDTYTSLPESYDGNAAFMYIDASDLPGQIARLNFDANLCAGSRLYVSAWLASPAGSRTSPNVAPANVIFRVVGHTSTNSEEDRPETIYTFAPGPIFGTSRTSNGSLLEKAAVENGIWQQVFFYFTNNSTTKFVNYSLLVDNACISTDGGDILIDDIEVFTTKPEVEVEETTPVCGTEVTLTKMIADFDDFIGSLGLTENVLPTSGYPRIWYCLVDKEGYDAGLEALRAGKSAEDITPEEMQTLFDKYLVGNPRSSDPADMAFRSVKVRTKFDSIPVFNYQDVLTTTGSMLSRETVTNAEGETVRKLVISDRISSENLLPKHAYYIVFVPRYGNDPVAPENSAAEFQMGTSCCILSSFKTTSAVQIYSNTIGNENDEDVMKVCAGQNVNLTVKLQGINAGSGATTERLIYYDWWLDFNGGPFEKIYINTDGSLAEIDPADATAEQVSLREALNALRQYYPEAISVQGLTPASHPDKPYALTQQMLTGIANACQPTLSGPHLVLHSTSVNVQMPKDLDDEIRSVTVIPIEFTDANVVYCFEPQRIGLKMEKSAPDMVSGLYDHTYPEGYANAPIRSTLARIAPVKAAEATPGTQPAHLLRVPLRIVKTVSPSADRLIPSLQGGTYCPVYLSGTNDPACTVYTTNPQGEMFMREVGRVATMVAPTEGNEDRYTDIYFYHDFTPREGYTYAVRIDYEEGFPDGHTKTDEENTVCQGSIVFDLKVVPEYLVWTGHAGNSDWSNDANWKRASRSERQLGAADVYDDTNQTADDPALLQTDNGFVPLEDCNVIVAPADRYPALNDTLNGKTASAQIAHELVMKVPEGGTVKTPCVAFYTNLCKDLVLKAGAELVHAERLGYHKAWMEYDLAAGRWYTLGTALQDVVAGDWYAPTATGRESAPYFRNVTFDPAQHNRFAPAVYQRGWDKGSATVYYLSALNNAPSAEVKNKDVAVAADWSATFNDVTVPYGAGGFSVKANPQGTKTEDGKKKTYNYSNLLFRVPKEDTSYNYYEIGFDTPSNQPEDASTPISRTNAGRFFLSTDTEFTLTATNKLADNLFYLVGNPFPCGLDMKAFFDENTDLEKKYWLLTANGQSAAMRTGEGWISVNKSGVFPDGQGVLAPGQGFFVKASTAPVGGKLQAKFTAAMQSAASDKQAVLQAPPRAAAASPTLRITAERDGLRSEALVRKGSDFANSFAPAEDMELLWDNTQREAPTVYTIAGEQASTVNCRRSLHRLPLGIVSSSDAPVRLTFSGLETFSESLSVLDALTGEVTPLTLHAQPLPGTGEMAATLEVPGLAAGRYFLLSSELPDPEDDLATAQPLVVVDGRKVTVTASDAHPLVYVHIVDAEGRTLYSLTPFKRSIALKLPTGAYVVEARTQEEATTAKIAIGK
ncbi:MAG: hypothetical protein SPK03_08625 [Alloprevotella sp.]|nr:hypothetical protein [Alloprevotella sp.]